MATYLWKTSCIAESTPTAIALVGGLHPAHIDDRLNGDRYKTVHKLGYGTSSTVWLARDRVLRKYVALKIKEAGISKFHNEPDILNHISKFKSDHPGRIYNVASLLLGRF